jgi:hypothetical protein
MEALRRPSSGSAYTAWAGSLELRCAARAGAALLRHARGARPEACGALQSALAAAAQARPPAPQRLELGWIAWARVTEI